MCNALRLPARRALIRLSASVQLPGGGGGGTGNSPPMPSWSVPKPCAVSLTGLLTRLGLAHLALCIAPPGMRDKGRTTSRRRRLKNLLGRPGDITALANYRPRSGQSFERRSAGWFLAVNQGPEMISLGLTPPGKQFRVTRGLRLPAVTMPNVCCVGATWTAPLEMHRNGPERGREGHSPRSACRGSTPAARRSGIQVAMRGDRQHERCNQDAESRCLRNGKRKFVDRNRKHNDAERQADRRAGDQRIEFIQFKF